MSFKNGKNAFAVFELMNEILNEEKLFLSIEILRTPIYDDEHCITAVHEAGHTLCQLVEFGEFPIKVCAFSPNTHSIGYMEKQPEEFLTKEMLQSYITVILGGWAAEKIIFGEDKLTWGCNQDIGRATENAISAIQHLGFGGCPIHIQRKSSSSDEGIEYDDTTQEQIKRLIDNCLVQAETHITHNKKLLLDIASSLLNNSHLTTPDLKVIVKRNDFKLHKKSQITEMFEEELKKENIIWESQFKK